MASVIPRIIRANLTDSMGARILLFCFFHLNLSKPPREAGASKTTALRYRLSSGARSAIDSLKRDPDRVIMRGQEASAGFDD
jgi:hypothetical protein